MIRDTRPAAFVLPFFALAACLLTLFNRFVGYLVPLPSFASVSGHSLSIVYLAALLLVLLHMARAAARLPQSAGFLLVVGLAFAAPMASVLALERASLHAPSWLSLTANNLFLPIGAVLVGAAIGRVIRHPNTLLAGAGFSVFFDIVVVTMGTVSQLMQSGSNIIAAVSVGAGANVAPPPAFGGHALPSLPPPISGVTIGPADVLFLALFLSAVTQLNLSLRATFAWMYLLLLTALAVVETTGLPIPALAPMGIAVLIANLRHAAFTREEKYALIYGGGFAAICAVGIIVGSRAFIAPPPPKLGIAFQPTRQGLFIAAVVKDSPAEQAGLKKGDRVLAVNNILLRSLTDEELNQAIKNAPENGFNLLIQRYGEAKARSLTLRFPRKK